MQISGFRGWKQLDLRPNGHVVLSGVPHAGRSDIIDALARLLDLDAARSASLTDLHQEATESARTEQQPRYQLLPLVPPTTATSDKGHAARSRYDATTSSRPARPARLTSLPHRSLRPNWLPIAFPGDRSPQVGGGPPLIATPVAGYPHLPAHPHLR
ncbi:DUF2813 domain-containing protein [Actinomadura syzygii]|uniref:DUF2813 domain-containing protein n=1 Tax=Actinomadura syzygii TaxID=1427538 RepID=A0A5D0UAC1_9ACTN|nr:DUF2813 domain-containing protein [Actinomadura syzygii]